MFDRTCIERVLETCASISRDLPDSQTQANGSLVLTARLFRARELLLVHYIDTLSKMRDSRQISSLEFSHFLKDWSNSVARLQQLLRQKRSLDLSSISKQRILIIVSLIFKLQATIRS
jgi:hypothetical protein